MPLPKSTTNLKIHPMMPVTRAAKLLDLSVKKLEKRLEHGLIQGEKRQISERHGGKYSWFIYAGAFEELLETRVKACEARITTEGLDQIFFTDFDDDSSTDTVSYTELTTSYGYGIKDATTADIIESEDSGSDATIYGTSTPEYSLSLVAEISADTVPGKSSGFVESEVEPEDYHPATQIDLIDFTPDYYNQDDEQPLTTSTAGGRERQTNLALASELLQHLRQEKQRNEKLQNRIDELAGQLLELHSEMSAIKIEILSGPTHKDGSTGSGNKTGWFSRLKGYFGFSDGRM